MRENSHNRKISKAAAGVVTLTTILILLEAPALLWLEPAYGEPGDLSPQLRQLESQLTEEVKAALKAAEDNLKLPEGRKYDKALGPALAGDLNRIMNECFQANKASSFQSFLILVRIGQEGTVEKVYILPEIAIANCLKSALPGIQFPVPPGPAWWARIDVKIKNEDHEPERFRSTTAIV